MRSRFALRLLVSRPALPILALFRLESKRRFTSTAVRKSVTTFPPTSNERMQKLRSLFSKYKPNKKGEIEIKELVNDLQRVTKEMGAEWSHSEEGAIQQMVAIADLDNSGTIDFNEFIFWFDGLGDHELNLPKLIMHWSSTMTGFKDPQVLFEFLWRKLERAWGEENMRFPAEIMWLGGAPGAGKGTMTPFITRERGYSSSPVVVSSLINSPVAQRIKAAGGLVGDFEVLEALLRRLLQPEYRHSALVDGFPRTKMQVQFVRLLYDKMMELYHRYYHRDETISFNRPIFRIVVLFVDEAESVRRQLLRGKQSMEHNNKVESTGEGIKVEIRDTDVSAAAARRRYETFKKQTMDALLSLGDYFPYNIMDAMGTISETEKKIMKELVYQSSHELAKETYDAVKIIPTADDITLNARQQLVNRLNAYQDLHPETFKGVINVLSEEFIPQIRRQMLTGDALLHIRHPVFKEPLAIDMALDILADRRFLARVDMGKENVLTFRVMFKRPRLFTSTNRAE